MYLPPGSRPTVDYLETLSTWEKLLNPQSITYFRIRNIINIFIKLSKNISYFSTNSNLYLLSDKFTIYTT